MADMTRDTDKAAATMFPPAVRASIAAKAFAASRAAPIAETELAELLARDWCEQWGGWPTDHFERMGQIWAFRPEAKRLLAAMTRGGRHNRAALARALLAKVRQ